MEFVEFVEFPRRRRDSRSGSKPCPAFQAGGVTVMDRCSPRTNKRLRPVDVGPRAPVDGPSRGPTLN